MTRRTAVWTAWTLWALSVTLMAAGFIIELAAGQPIDGGVLAELSILLAFAAFPTVGAFIAARHPGNAVGWIYCLVGLNAGLMALSDSYTYYTLVEQPEALPGATLAAWFQGWLWFPTIGLVLTFSLLLFPDGKLPSPRWRFVAWSAGAVLATITVGGMLDPRLEDEGYSIRNPIGVDAVGDPERTLAPVLALALGVAVCCLASLVLRFIRATGEQRQQLKWLTYAAALFVVGAEASELLNLPEALFPIFLVAIPASVGMAILKYRLYDIDVLINRTLVYSLLTATLAFAYFGAVVLLQQLFAPITPESDLAVAGSTLAVAALFRPARSRIQSFIDRRFYRRKYDAANTLEAFAARLRDEVNLETLTADLLTVVKGTMQPAHVSLWLRAPEAG